MVILPPPPSSSMGIAAPSRYQPPGLRLWTRSLSRASSGTGSLAEAVGHQLTFLALVLGSVPRAARHYRRQTGALLVDIAWGNGSIIVGGGVVGVLVFMGLAIGASVGIEGFSALDLVGMGPLTGFISSYGNTREMAPIVTAVGFAAQTGCRMTAEIGAMRISEEIDALEAQGIRPIPFVVTTRVLAGLVTIVPLYVLTLLLSYVSCAVVVNVLHGQSEGTYYHYFNSFIQPSDVALSIVKAAVFVVAVIAIHGYQGYYASGGPEGVGVATGRAIRASLVAIVLLDMVLTIAFWGQGASVKISG